MLVPKVNHINDVSLASDGSFYVSHMAPHGFSVADFLVTTITRGIPDMSFVGTVSPALVRFQRVKEASLTV